MAEKKLLPECPNCQVYPVTFRDQAEMYVVVCEYCGLVTKQHAYKSGAEEEWRDIVDQINQIGDAP